MIMFNINTYNKQCEEEFEEKFTELNYGWGSEGYEKRMKKCFPSEIKDFITTSQNTLLKKFLESERERLEKQKYQQPLLGTPESTLRVIEAVNTTIDEVIKLISKKDN